MSEKLPQQSQSEEVDLGQLFNAIGRLFEKLFAFIGRIFKAIFSAIIYALKPVVNNFKLISIIVMIAGIIGFVSDKLKDTVYYSDMLVKPYFDSKYQLANNVDYFNALIDSENLPELARIFEIDTSEAKELISFEIEIGPETQNDLLIEYDEYISSIDSILADDVTFDDYVLNRGILEGKIFSIKAKSYKVDVFQSLEKGFENTFENDYSVKLKKIRDSSLLVKRAAYNKELEKIDSLQQTYLQIMKMESENGGSTVSPNSFLPIMQERTKTREYDLFQEELKIREKIRSLDETLIEESDYFDILSRFEEVGTKETSYFSTYIFVIPALSIAILAYLYILLSIVNYIKNYE